MDSSAKSQVGRVFLVGAGPGDPGLITVRGADCLAQADLVLYDGLVNPLLLRLTRGRCERTARASRPGSAIVAQSELNARLIAEARSGLTVVRLKGGDPYIFGRGSEEAAALADAGIPFEVVPGITAATGAGEYAGFSFTHRDLSSAVAFITGHEDPTRSIVHVDYHALAKFPGTLVFYMGLNRLPDICAQLIAGGLSNETPAAVICQASLPTQQVVEATLESLPDVVARVELKPPSLIVVGECVRQRERLNWFERLPLFGVSIGITRAAGQANDVVNQVVRLGGEPVLMPLIEIQPVDRDQQLRIAATLHRLDEFSWLVFTSVNGVSEFARHLLEAGLDLRALSSCRIAAIGPGTSERLLQVGLRADLIPAAFRSESLALELKAVVPAGGAVLWLRASRGRDVLPLELSAAGIMVEELVVYVNQDVDQLPLDVVARIRSGSLNWITLSSPAMSRQLAALLSASGFAANSMTTKLASLSPVTTSAANEAGLSISVEAPSASWDELITAVATDEQATRRR